MRTVLLLAGTLTMGLVAGTFALYAHTVMATLGEPAFGWTAAALLLYLFSFGATIAVNVPLNEALKAAGDPGEIEDLGAVRERFAEARWATWNLARTLTRLGAFGCLAWALVLQGRATA